MRQAYMRKVDREAYINSKREIDIHKELSHPNIIRLYEIIEDEDDKVYMIMEFAEEGELCPYDTEIKQFCPEGVRDRFLDEKKVLSYSQQLLSALAYLHSKNFMHCDLKPQNVLISKGLVKLADFGSAQMFYGEDDTLL